MESDETRCTHDIVDVVATDEGLEDVVVAVALGGGAGS